MDRGERIIFLNQAAESWQKAPGVVEAVCGHLHSVPHHPGRTSGPGSNALNECRGLLANLLQVNNPNRIVLCTGATQAINLAILGLRLQKGARVVTTVTEHNSVLRPLNHLSENIGVRITYAGLDDRGDIDVDAFTDALQDNAQLAIVNHASNVTGRINDVAMLFAKAKEAGAYTLLDASQSLGIIPVRPLELNADMVAFTGHKWLRGPSGTGGLYVKDGLELQQVLVGGTGVRSDLALHPPQMPMRLEAGTPNVPAFSGLCAALQWHRECGDEFNTEGFNLAQELRNQLREIDAVHIFDDGNNHDHTGVVSFCVDNWSVEDIGYVLEESFGIICRTGLHCAPLIHSAIGSMPQGTVRFSLSGSNTIEDVETAAQAVRRLAA